MKYARPKIFTRNFWLTPKTSHAGVLSFAAMSINLSHEAYMAAAIWAGIALVVTMLER